MPKRMTHRGLAPVLRPILKKKRPRGKPFPKCNAFGLATRFVPGNCANPGGRPSFKEVSRASRAWLAARIPGDPYERTGAELIVEILGQQALAGDRGAAAELVDRAEGRAHVSIGMNDGPDPLTRILDEITRRSESCDRPEGHTILALSEGEQEAQEAS